MPEGIDEVGDLVVFFERVTQRMVGSDHVVVSATLFPALDAPDGLQIGEDLGGGALGDVDAFGNLLEAEIGRCADGEQHVRVIGEERPRAFGGHGRSLHRTREYERRQKASPNWIAAVSVCHVTGKRVAMVVFERTGARL